MLNKISQLNLQEYFCGITSYWIFCHFGVSMHVLALLFKHSHDLYSFLESLGIWGVWVFEALCLWLSKKMSLANLKRYSLQFHATQYDTIDLDVLYASTMTFNSWGSRKGHWNASDCSQRHVGTQMGVSHSDIGRLLKLFEQTDNVGQRTRIGRPKVTTARQDQQISKRNRMS